MLDGYPRTTRRVAIAGLALLVLGCASDPQRPAERPAQMVQSRDGVVATADTRATRAGVRMLELGGNAADAAVAAGFALAVVEPSMSGIGGRAIALVRQANGEVSGVDGMSEVPSGYVPESGAGPSRGYRTIGVPGAVAAYVKLLDDYGRLPLEVVMQPAIELAADGFILPFSTTDEVLLEFPGTRATFRMPDGTGYRVGERFVQPDLARTLRQIAAGGADAFYRGEMAVRIADDMRRNGGLVTRADLANYRARPLRILRGDYRGHELIGTGSPPSGYMLIEALQIMAHFDLARASEAEWANRVCQSLRRARRDRDSLPGPAHEREDKMISKSWAAVQAASLDADTEQANGAAGIDEHTSHLSVVDGNGMVVLLTQSLGPEFGSHVVTPGLGFLYAVTMGEYKDGEAGTRPNLSQSPMIVMRDGVPLLALGAAGGGRIPSAILNVISRVLDRGASLEDAMRAPRVHVGSDCPQLENTGTLRFIGEVADDRLNGTFESDLGATYPVIGIRRPDVSGPGSAWDLVLTGASTHPYADMGAWLELRVVPDGQALRAGLTNGANPADGQPVLPDWVATDVVWQEGLLRFTLPARIAWPTSAWTSMQAIGLSPGSDQPVARVHALAFDAASGLWHGVADPRGRGSAEAIPSSQTKDGTTQ